MKKLLYIPVILILIFAVYYFITVNNTIEVNETSPLIQDSLDSMDEQTKQEFEAQLELMQDKVIEMQDDMPAATLISQGIFKPRVHSVQGNALLIEENNKKTLRFEDFETDNGPRLHIYLSKDLSDNDFIDLGEIKATKGNVNYEIPENVNTEEYNKVLVWCVPFKVLFSYAELN